MYPPRPRSASATTWLTVILLVATWLGASNATSAGPQKPERPSIYDTKADARQQIAAALKEAKRENKRVLLQFGANWCIWCHRLHDLFKSDRQLARELLYEYVLVLVDVDRVDGRIHNEAVNKQYGNPVRLGLPALVVLDADGKQLATQGTEPFEVKDHHDPAKVLAFLTEWRAKPVSAEATLAAGLAEAKSKSKNVFLYFSAPWCGYCRKLDAYLARADVAGVFQRAFVPVKIDVDRMDGGDSLDARFRGDRQGGIPFFVVLDPSGKTLADSWHPEKGNVGFPVEPHEVAHFMKVMKQTGAGFTDAQLSTLRQAFAKP